MPTAALTAYLAQLSNPDRPGGRLWLNERGQAEGKFFNCVLTSAYIPVLALEKSAPVGYEAVVRNVDTGDAGLPLWRMLDRAASDDESVELDRLCRMLHAINFFRQPAAQQADLYLSVHNRLLSSVSSNHGYAFRRILDALELPVERIVLQLPDAGAGQRWLLGYVTDNYKRNGMRMALTARSGSAAIDLLSTAAPAALKIRQQDAGDDGMLARLAALSAQQGARLIVTGVDDEAALARVRDAGQRSGHALAIQGQCLAPARSELAAGAAYEAARGVRASVGRA